MPYKNIVIIGSYLPDFESEYQAWLNYLSAENIEPPAVSDQIKQNSYIKELKSAGVYARLDDLLLMDKGNRECSKINVIDPGAFSATEVNNPTWDAGFEGDGISSYLDSNYIPGTNYGLADANIGVYANNENSTGRILGSRDDSLFRTEIAADVGISGFELFWSINGSTGNEGAKINSKGLFSVDKNGSAEKIFRNENVAAEVTRESSGIPQVSTYLLAFNNRGNPISFSDNKVKIFWAGGSLSDIWNDFVTATNNYLEL